MTDDATTTNTTSATKPGIEERYHGALHASNLRVQAERNGAADVLIAMGWSPSGLGAALKRLHGEWNGAQFPRRPTQEAIRRLASTFKRGSDGMVQVDNAFPPQKMLPQDAARHQANAWYQRELQLCFGTLKSMPNVRRALTHWAADKGFKAPQHQVAEVLAWWLNHICPDCNGRGKECIPGTPMLSHRACPACHGSKETPIPHRRDDPNYAVQSRKLLQHMEVCVATSTASVRGRLREMRRG